MQWHITVELNLSHVQTSYEDVCGVCVCVRAFCDRHQSDGNTVRVNVREKER